MTADTYTELESLGVIETIAGKGCFLKENDCPLTKQVRHKLLEARIDEAIVTAHQMRIGPQVLRDLVEERIRFFDRKNAAPQPDIKEKEQIWRPTSPATISPVSIEDMAHWTPLTD